MIVKYGTETTAYGPPHGYVVTVRGIGEDGLHYGATKAIPMEYVEIGGWFGLWLLFDGVTAMLRARGAEPLAWDCGGWWREEWSENDEYGDYKW